MPASTRSARAAPAVWLSLLFVFALALVLHDALPLNLDVSWGITMAEKVLDGERLYVDIIETNPPAVVFLYLPAVALARFLSLRPEIVFDAMVFAMCGSSLWLSGGMLRSAARPHARGRGLLAVLFALALMILPAQIFGEREHVAIILFLPVLALALLRAMRIAPRRRWVIAAGLASGFVACIKPHFILAIVFTAAAAAWSARSWRPLFAPEHGIAALLAAAYGVVIVVVYPEFIRDIVPLVLAVYVPVKVSAWHLLTHGAMPLWIAVLLLVVALERRAVFAAPLALLLAASCGFALAFVIQGKGWPYQSYPMLVLALAALMIALARRWPAIRRRRVAATGAALLAVALAGGAYHWLGLAADTRSLAARIAVLKPRPKMLCICAAYRVAHPLVREAGGVWVSRVGSLWITANAMILDAAGRLDPLTRIHLAVLAERDRNMLSEDIANGEPDIIVVERAPFDGLAWAASDPVLSRQLTAYREVEMTGGITVLERTGGPPPAR